MSHFSEAGLWLGPKLLNDLQDRLSAAPGQHSTPKESVGFLRLQLKQLNAWPDAGDTFLELLEQVSDYGITLTPSDYEWLERVACDALVGRDIGLLYPSIFQKLLVSMDLRQKFLQTLQQMQNADQ